MTRKKCEHGKQKAFCKKCGGSQICKHGIQKQTCKECGGSAFCEHDRIKSHCKDCGGSQICEHDRIKSRCKDCGGSAFCEHGKQKSHCKDCGGSQICKHGRHKSTCKECGGSSICQHGIQKQTCKDCGGSAFCEHGMQKAKCKECGGSAFCEHGIQKQTCKDCGGSAFCEHGIQKQTCKDCGGSSICQHGKQKAFCKDCGGSALCKSSWCETTGNKKYEGYCFRCFCFLFPDKPVSRNYKTKETEVFNFVKDTFPEQTWISDKVIAEGCSRRRPDILCDLGYQVIIVEVDENNHESYDCSCENKRVVQLSQDVGHRPLVIIRFNPDKYIDENGKVVKSCWSESKETRKLRVDKKEENNWIRRLDVLRETVKYWINPENMTDKMIEIVELFYDHVFEE
jgi:hypothetical protein